ncbi:MAG: DUF935 family protein [Rhodobacteraceae bacterium]|nr:DUF935 family protein [Paracoccaceae bacterium]
MRKPTLLDARGRPVKRAGLKNEIAAAQTVGVRSPITGHPAANIDPTRLASILREAESGNALRYFELAEVMEERDLHYAGVLGTRKRSVAQIDITVKAASDEKHHVEHAEMIRTWLERDELSTELFNMLDAVGKGYSVTEIIWDSSTGQFEPNRLEYVDPRWTTLDRVDLRTPLLRTENGDVPLEPFKFINTVISAKSGLPIRGGLARLAAWGWMFKMFTQRDWAIFTQNFGQPIRVGKYQNGATEEDKETLFRAVQNIAGDCAAIMPSSMEIEFIESKITGSSLSLYKERSDWLDQQVSKGVLGQTTTTDAISGGHAVSKEHRQVQEDIERADAKALQAVLNRDLVRPYVDLNYGPQKKYPRLVIARPEQKDVKLIVESVERLAPLGFKVSQKTMQELLGLPEVEAGDQLLGAAPLPVDHPMPAAQLALQAAQDDEDSVDDQLTKGATDIAEAPATVMINTIRKLLGEVKTMEEFRDRLLELDKSMSEADLAEALRLAMVWSALTGEDELA